MLWRYCEQLLRPGARGPAVVVHEVLERVVAYAAVAEVVARQLRVLTDLANGDARDRVVHRLAEHVERVACDVLAFLCEHGIVFRCAVRRVDVDLPYT